MTLDFVFLSGRHFPECLTPRGVFDEFATNRVSVFVSHCAARFGRRLFPLWDAQVFPDLSPAEMLASQTIMRLTSGWLDASQALFYLAILECAPGMAMLFNVCMRAAFVLFLFHMIGTFAPLFLLPELTIKISPLAPTMEGQYILKNIVFVAAGWAVFFPYIYQQHGRSAGRRQNPLHSAAS